MKNQSECEERLKISALKRIHTRSDERQKSREVVTAPAHGAIAVEHDIFVTVHMSPKSIFMTTKSLEDCLPSKPPKVSRVFPVTHAP